MPDPWKRSVTRSPRRHGPSKSPIAHLPVRVHSTAIRDASPVATAIPARGSLHARLSGKSRLARCGGGNLQRAGRLSPRRDGGARWLGPAHCRRWRYPHRRIFSRQPHARAEPHPYAAPHGGPCGSFRGRTPNGACAVPIDIEQRPTGGRRAGRGAPGTLPPAPSCRWSARATAAADSTALTSAGPTLTGADGRRPTSSRDERSGRRGGATSGAWQQVRLVLGGSAGSTRTDFRVSVAKQERRDGESRLSRSWQRGGRGGSGRPTKTAGALVEGTWRGPWRCRRAAATAAHYVFAVLAARAERRGPTMPKRCR
jgi:hypothetical protein